MKSLPCFSSPLLLLYLSLLSIMPAFTVTRNGPELDYVNCRDTVFKCGKLYAGYPFYGGDRGMGCGHPGLELRCEANFTTIDILGVKYQVLEIRYDRHILRIQREDFMNGGFCNPQTPIQNSMIDHELFDVGPGITNLTLYYDCSPSISSTLRQIPCNSYSNYKNVTVTTQNVPPHGCVANLTFLVLQTSLVRFLTNPSVNVAMEEGLKGLEVKWKDWEQACSKCTASGGACGFDHLNQTICICQNSSPNMHECHRPGSKSIFKSKRNLVFIGLEVAAIVLVSTICCVVLWLKVKSLSDHLHQEKMKENARIEAFITKFSSFSPNRYSYGEIKKMTNIFSDKLGQGGYGSVYKGKLPEGRLVAVKVLNESKGNGEDFMNEVASISRTSHVNIVTLLGFCFAKSKRALVYEFMPHGSLDRFIYGQGLRRRSRQLELKTLYDIALGIARGLEYLHQGCNTRILHFDIKPHNILLDENFIPKISDFGLSKSCERKESIISMACARGTIGYIAPEVFCRNFGGVSYKSDVYSYGMMVFEIIGVRKNMDVGVSEKSEEYFPSWIYKHLDKSINLNLDGGIVEEEEEEEEEMTRKLLIVSLWCIQFHPSDRPSMTKVLEMLQGSLQSLIIPPKPFVSSPVRLPGIHIETSSSSMI